MALGLAFEACKKPYTPPVIVAPNSYLVIEGVINSGTDSTFIKISRTVNLSAITTLAPEAGGQASVQSDAGTSYPLTEKTNGVYASAALNLNAAHKYRLAFTTSVGKQYQSDFVAVLNSPPIDSINYIITSTGLNIYANTHDPRNNTHYYRWDYQETWLIQSDYFSYFKSNGDTVLQRDLINDNIYTCWQSDTSSNLVLASSAKLSQDIISQTPILFVPSSSEKIAFRYSIGVRQYALTGDAFNFWQNLKLTSQQLGSIFSPQPSQLNGNIHSVSNTAEPVLGYISVGATSSTRIFIDKTQLPVWLTTKTYPDCMLDTFLYVYYPPFSKIPQNQVKDYINYHTSGLSSPFIPINAYGPPGKKPLGYTASTRECVDCTVRGTNKKPAFWR